jgi:DNA-binding NarL/FixJ family response regulator
MSATETIRIAAVDDDASFLAFLAEAIAPHGDLQLCATALTVQEALSLLQGPPVDVILVDLGLPDGSGTELIARIAEAWPTCEVLVSTSFGDDLSVIESFEAGASGYLLKQPHAGSLVEDIRMLRAGGSPISPMIARLVLQRLKPGPRSEAASPTAQGVSAPAVGAPRVAHDSDGLLSTREREVLELITKGFTTEEIAGLMSLSRNTVLTYVRRTYRKLNVSSKTEAIFEARSQGLIR